MCLTLGGAMLLAWQAPVFAQNTTATDTFGLQPIAQVTVLGANDIRVTVARIINAALAFLGVVAVVIVLYGGYLFLTSAGNEEQISQAKKLLVNGVIGLVIILSAFSISYFILRQLSDATGSGSVPLSSRCESLRIANDPAYMQQCGRDSLNCSVNPAWCCALNHFVVRSITPLTEAANINDVHPRVLLSQGTRNAVDDVFRIYRDTTSTDITDQFAFTFLNDEHSLVEATYQGTSACTEPGCVPGGRYLMIVNPDLRDSRGRVLEQATSCGAFAPTGTFTVNTVDTQDDARPVGFPGIAIDGEQGRDLQVIRGQNHVVSINVSDTAGVSYVRLQAGPVNDQVLYYDGPATGRGSDAPVGNPYPFVYSLFVSRNTPAPSVQTVTTTLYDIDGREQIVTTTMVIVGEHCHNNIQDDDETGVDIGGTCPAMGACTQNGECASDLCVSNQCVPAPLITDVSPRDGAVGNMITISGRYFGAAPGNDGAVQFGVDGNGDGEYERWVEAPLAACSGRDVWNESWIVVSVPEDPGVTHGPIRVVRGTVSDSTIDGRGPIPGADGLFTKNNTARPGLCAVTTPSGATAGSPGDPVIAYGRGFGANTGRLDFGDVSGAVRAWSLEQVNSQIPATLNPGRVGVVVSSNDNSVSNGVPFTIVEATGEAADPLITGIDPATTTPGSLVTLYGQHFGDHKGFVFLTTDPTIRCALGVSGCVEADLDFPACSNSWSDAQLVFAVPDTFTPPTRVYVTVQNSPFARRSSGDSSFGLELGPAAPGICELSPATGPAPLANGERLAIHGINFLPGARVFFWPGSTGTGDLNTWLTTSNNDITIQGGNTILTPIPVSAVTGQSMQTGPIRVQNDNRVSNSVQYTVNDCTAMPTSTIPSGYHCCRSGADQGILRPTDYICAEETRNAGYVWRFTTGHIPHVPSVIEECVQDSSSALVVPSPSPWRTWDHTRGRDAGACLNATINVRFTSVIQQSSLFSNIRVATCGTGAEPDCAGQRLDIPQNGFSYGYQYSDTASLLTVYPASFSGTLDDNTWYHVELLTGIQSEEWQTILGRRVQTNVPLRVSRSCGRSTDGRDTAYCFDFKTAPRSSPDAVCQLQQAAVFPSAYTTNFLGVVDEQNVTLPSNSPLYYLLWGQSNQACVAMNVDGLGWTWTADSPTAVTAASVAVAPGTAYGHVYRDSRAVVTAMADTGADTIKIHADNSTLGSDSSLLTVDLGEPTVIDYWPQCTSACVNADLGVVFNQAMATATFAGHVEIHECLDSLCTTFNPSNIPIASLDETDPRIYRFAPLASLLPDAAYIVIVTPRIRAQTMFGNLGSPVEQFSWTFRTKDGAGFCAIDSVQVSPDPFTAYVVGEHRDYIALPHGSPDACSRFGQELNPSNYGWSWQTADPQVAAVSTITRVAPPRLSCTNACLPRGSTRTVASSGVAPALCGDGVIDRGEDCDLGHMILNSDGTPRLVNGSTMIEQVGVSCTTACLRPGSTLATCGNSQIEPELGEECDPGGDKTGSAWRSCSQTCLRLGASQTNTTPGEPRCGNTTVDRSQFGQGEDCDINASGETTGVTCSAQCLRVGSTGLSAIWCASHPLEPACASAVSVCGNGSVEPGEECEAGADDTTIIVSGGSSVTVSSASQVCSNRCLLQNNICAEPNIPSTYTCVANTPGCGADCLPLGSSRSYSTPSVCGDAVLGIGESPLCEYTPTDYPATSLLGQDPFQIVTAIGLRPVTVQGAAQITTVQASAVATRDANGQVQSLAQPVSGQGDYTLQCGNVEYATPVTTSNAPLYNDCAANVDRAGNTDTGDDNTEGVGTNSCCYERPRRTSEYPIDGSGLSTTGPAACQNTYIEVNFDHVIAESTVTNNIAIVSGSTASTACAGDASRDMTSQVRASLLTQAPISTHWWNRVGDWLLAFFGQSASASNFNDPQVQHWCDGTIRFHTVVTYPTDAPGQLTRVHIYLDDALLPNHTYAIVLRGGPAGIRDDRGVGIRALPLSRTSVDDSWIFRTSDRICTLSEVRVVPSDYLFTAPNTSAVFSAMGYGSAGEQIVPIPLIYDWTWTWGPTNHPIFDIPVPSTAPGVDSALETISSKTVEGRTTAYVNAQITADTNTNSRERIVTGSSILQAIFCERPWPDRTSYPYEDGNPPGRAQNDDGVTATTVGGVPTYFNYSFGYCADAGLSGRTTDDLPFLHSLTPTIQRPTGPVATCGTGFTKVGSLCVRNRLAVCVPPTDWTTHAYTSRAHSNECIPDPAFNPRPLGTIDSLTSAALLQRAVDVVLFGQYAYVASLTGNGVEVVDISNPRQPQHVAAIRTGYRNAALSSPRKLFIAGNYLYVVSSGSNAIEIYSLTQPEAPASVASIVNGTDGAQLNRPYDIYVTGGYAYVASLTSNALEIIDVNDPTNPKHVSSIVHGAAGAVLDGPVAVVVAHDVAYVAAVRGNAIQAIGVADPLIPKVVGVVRDGDSGAVLRGVQDITVSGNYLYAVVNRPSNALQVIDISEPYIPRALSVIEDGVGGAHLNGAFALDIQGNFLYTVAEQTGAFDIFDITDHANPVHRGSILTSRNPLVNLSAPEGVVVRGNYAYVAAYGNGALQILNITPPPAVTASCDVGEQIQSDGTCTVSPSCPQSPIRYDYNSRYDVCAVHIDGLTNGLPDLLPSPLKKILFFGDKPTNHDVIGLQVFDNVERLSAHDWYDRYFQGAERFQSANIGLDAVQNASNLYVNFLDERDSADDIANYILNLSINADAQDETRQVYTKIISSLKFNINLTDFGYCAQGNTRADITRPATDISVPCTTDFECLASATNESSDRVCANALTKLLRDWQRLSQVKSAETALGSYAAGHNGTYPLFSSGSYLPNYTNSNWNLSWRTLRDIAPSLGRDPINNWSACTNADPNTCWNATNATFVCPQLSSVYEYEVDSTGAEYTLHVPLEYFDGTSPLVAALTDDGATSSRITSARWCIPNQIYSPFRQECGDGAVNTAIGEECDPPNGRVFVNTGSCTAVATCDSQCHIPATSCVNQCGNGQIDGNEICDDGTGVNGTYNHCSTQCDGRTAGLSCGDGTINTVAGQQLEYCDIGDTRYTTNGYCDEVSCHNGARYTATAVGTTADAFTSLQIIAPNHVWAVGSFVALPNVSSHILEYIGGNWTTRFTISRGLAAQNSVAFEDIAFPDAVHGYVVGDAVYRSVDSGRTWSTVTLPGIGLTTMLRGVYFTSANEGWAVGDGGRIFHTSNYGVDWQAQTSGTTVNLRDVFFVNSRTGIAVGDRGTILSTTDSGVTWIAQASGTTEALNSVTFSSSTPRVGWIVGNNGTVLYSTTLGVSWQSLPSAVITGNLQDITVRSVTTTVIVGDGGRVYTTGNNGSTWTAQDTGVTGNFLTAAGDSAGVIWIAGSTGAYTLGVDPYCLSTRLCTTASVCQYGDACVAVADPSYHLDRSYSCASDCQGVGGFCGDGYAQAQYEQCDDGNTNDADACSNQCYSRVGAAVNATNPVGPDCGNGLVEPEKGEGCDLGIQNGTVCDPTYNHSCNYCSNTCRVLTRDPAHFCGDGQLDQIGGTTLAPVYEACDVINNADGTTSVIGPVSASQPTVEQTLVCNDLGSFSCTNSCTTLVNNCVSCGLRPIVQGGSVPQIAFLNPMVSGNTVSGSRQFATSTGAARWAENSYTGLYVTEHIGITQNISVSVPTDFAYHPLTLSDPIYTAHYTVQQHMLVNAGAPVATIGLESSALCADSYHVRFDRQASPVNPANIRSAMLGSFTGGSGVISSDQRIPGDVFPYPVAGEQGIIHNELEISPPVPPGVFRIVVRWGNAEADAGAIFSGMIYNPAFAGSGQGSVVGYTRALSDTRVDTRPGMVSKVCYDMAPLANPAYVIGTPVQPLPDQYWWPTGCDPFGYYGTVFIHPIRGLSHIFTQAMTVRTTHSDANAPQFGTYTFAFFVDAIGQPMTNFQNHRTLNVEVYSYHAGQEPFYSLFLPEVFRIDLANPSDHEGAEYWHVFNLVRTTATGAYTIERFGQNGNGAVVTDFQAVMDDIAGNAGASAGITFGGGTGTGGLGESCNADRSCSGALACDAGNICRQVLTLP